MAGGVDKSCGRMQPRFVQTKTSWRNPLDLRLRIAAGSKGGGVLRQVLTVDYMWAGARKRCRSLADQLVRYR